MSNINETDDNELVDNKSEQITIEQLKEVLSNNAECKNYIDNLIETEINNRYPQKTELERVMEEKRQLELQIKYQSLMAENKLPLELLDFVAGKDVEETVSKIEKFNKIVEDLIEVHRQEWTHEWINAGHYTPPGENGLPLDEQKDIWKMMM